MPAVATIYRFTFEDWLARPGGGRHTGSTDRWMSPACRFLPGQHVEVRDFLVPGDAGHQGDRRPARREGGGRQERRLTMLPMEFERVVRGVEVVIHADHFDAVGGLFGPTEIWAKTLDGDPFPLTILEEEQFAVVAAERYLRDDDSRW